MATVDGYNNRQRKALDSVAVIPTAKQLANQPKEVFKINGNGASTSRRQENDPIELNGHHFDDVEILPEPIEDFESDLINNTTPAKRSLMDRF